MKIADLFSVAGKVVVVTGGSRGIGEMIARAYVENGAKVYITARNAAVCDGLAAELSKFGACVSIPANLADMAEIDRFAAEIERRETKDRHPVQQRRGKLGRTVRHLPRIRVGQGYGS